MRAQDKLIKYMLLKIQAALKIHLIGTHIYSLNILPGLWKTQEPKKPQLSHSLKKTEKEIQQVSFPQSILHSCLRIKLEEKKKRQGIKVRFLSKLIVAL